MLPHTASPPFSANRQPSLTHIDTPPSLPHSQKRREFVKYARRQDAEKSVVFYADAEAYRVRIRPTYGVRDTYRIVAVSVA